MGIPVDLCRKREFATEQIWERKWEVDSPAAFLRLSHEYYSRFRKSDIFNMNFFKAIARILSVLDEQTNDSSFEQKMGKNFYTFKRSSEELPGGTIKRAVYTGMIKTGFRPSDSPN
jgi:meiotically up-regulated gene 157 (Mug157) protein